MRGMVTDLDTPVPLVTRLPGIYQDGDFTARFVSAFDTALAPVFSTLDNLAAYVDPRTAPADLLAYVGSWVGAPREDDTAVAVQRLAVAEAVRVHRLRGTATGVRDVVAHLTGGQVLVQETGAAAWSAVPAAPLPGSGPPHLTVRVAVADPESVDRETVRQAVAESVPPYVTFEVEVVGQ